MVTFNFTLRSGIFTGPNRIIRPKNIEGGLAPSSEILGGYRCPSPSSAALDLNDIMESENDDKQSGISVAEKQNAKPDDARQLKRARSNAKGTLSKRQNNIIELV